MSRQPPLSGLAARLDIWKQAPPFPSLWVKYGPLSIYLRRTDTVWDGARLRTITLASVGVKPRFQRRGWFSAVIDWAEAQKDFQLVRAESVITEPAARLLSRRGYISNGATPPDFGKLI